MNGGAIGFIDIIGPICKPGVIPGKPAGGNIPGTMPGITPGALPNKPSGFTFLAAGSSSSSESSLPPAFCLSCSFKSAAGIPNEIKT